MRFKLRSFLLASASLLALQTVVAQPVSTSNAVTLEQGLNCLDWAKQEQSFSNQLATGDWTHTAASNLTTLQQQFKQHYTQQKSSVVDDPDDENYCEDCPEIEVYLPKDKSNPIQRIEALMQVSVAGASTSIYRNDDMAQTKQKLEEGLKIQFSPYSGQQYKHFKQQWDQASAHDNEKRTKTHQVFQQYPHLKVFNGEVFQNEKRYSPKRIYIYTQHYKRDLSDLTDMIAYISLYDHPIDPSQHILQCGFIDNMF
ncbi:hypothetical protein F946_01970 [Acinetobacter johnsonii ANC 3681]|uniref:Uncharacterized protein n=1 Tax=Acinetobacter johnsonii ANC 3681 TaxID=1217662 RepID=N9CVN9_ACIJO|nr:hypothetical protein [Acinetobacter johnsonii]ENV72495.1 hypothetical protein F946_01970 [Acinetobacter johnsonii ANC 3681]